MQLAPEWTKLAKLLEKVPEVKVAKVDCVAEPELCRENVVRSYPTMRLYPIDSQGTSRYYPYQGFHRDSYSLREWAVQYLPSVVETLTPYTFKQKVAQGHLPYLIDFYAPCKSKMACRQGPLTLFHSHVGCGHCQHFAPIFDDLALSLRDQVKCAKVNCDRFQQLCRQLGIRAYPTVRYFAGNTDVSQDVPSLDGEEIMNFVENKLASQRKKRQKIRDEL